MNAQAAMLAIKIRETGIPKGVKIRGNGHREKNGGR